MNGSTGFQPEFRLISSGVNHLKNPALREELGKPVRIPPIIGIRIPCNHFKNVHLVFEAHLRCPSLRAVGEDDVWAHGLTTGACLSSPVSSRERPMTQSLYAV